MIFVLGSRLVRLQCKCARIEDAVVVRCSAAGERTWIDPTSVPPARAAASDPDPARADSEQPAKRHPLGERLRVRRYTGRREQGAVAQLGERLAGSQKATGSSPVGSKPRFTGTTRTTKVAGANLSLTSPRRSWRLRRVLRSGSWTSGWRCPGNANSGRERQGR